MKIKKKKKNSEEALLRSILSQERTCYPCMEAPTELVFPFKSHANPIYVGHIKFAPTSQDICFSILRYYTSVKGYGRWWMWGDDCKGAACAQINIHQFILETLWKITNHNFYVLCMLYAKCYIHDVCKNATKYFILDINLNYTCSCMHL